MSVDHGAPNRHTLESGCPTGSTSSEEKTARMSGLHQGLVVAMETQGGLWTDSSVAPRILLSPHGSSCKRSDFMQGEARCRIILILTIRPDPVA